MTSPSCTVHGCVGREKSDLHLSYQKIIMRPNNPDPVTNKKDSVGEDNSNYVDSRTKYSAFGGSDSVAITKASLTTDSPETTGGSSPNPVLFAPNLFTTSVGGGDNGKNTNKKKNKIQEQKVSNTCETASCAIQKLSGYRGTALPITTLTMFTANLMKILVPSPLLGPDHIPLH